MMHPLKVFLFFVFASAVTMTLGLGVSLGGSLAQAAFVAVASSAMVGLFALGGGMGITIYSRSLFGLMQTGRVIQWPAFILSTWAGLSAAAWVFNTLFGTALAVSSGLFASLAIFAMAFGWGYLRGEIPWKGRTWMPVKMPNRK